MQVMSGKKSRGKDTYNTDLEDQISWFWGLLVYYISEGFKAFWNSFWS